MSEDIALYAGSFDPMTNGHLWVIESASRQFKTVYVAIGFNPGKPNERFPINTRLEMLKRATNHLSNVKITSFIGQYQVDFAESLGASVLIRGVRNGTDFMAESDMKFINDGINPNIDEMVFVPPKDLLQISSTTVMGLIGYEGWEPEVQKMVPNIVFPYLKEYQQSKDNFNLKRTFFEVCSMIKNGRSTYSEDLWNEFITRYSEPHRFYHTAQHIKYCLNEYELVRKHFEDSLMAKVGILYHDIIYNPLSNTNEIESVDYAEHCGLLNTAFYSSAAAKIIMATTHQQHNLSMDEKLVADIDIAGFGKSERIFRYNNELVRKEYPTIPEKEYAEGRIKVLSRFIKRPSIFLSPQFADRYERQARINLARHTEELKDAINKA